MLVLLLNDRTNEVLSYILLYGSTSHLLFIFRVSAVRRIQEASRLPDGDVTLRRSTGDIRGDR